jgi:gamma-glutamyltranspeptidase/glutathione hydrolase
MRAIPSPPIAGQRFKNPDLASTYRSLGSRGRDAFYRGEIAQRIVKCSEAQRGVLTADDLAAFDAEWVTPLSTTYRGWTIYELPPNGQGIAALMMLNLMEHSPIGSYGHNSAEALHTLIEAKKLAYADMAKWVCDPAFHDVPVEPMLSEAYALDVHVRSTLACEPGRRSGRTSDQGYDTTYLSVVDRDGNMVSLIQSIYANFGSGLVSGARAHAAKPRRSLHDGSGASQWAAPARDRSRHPGFMAKGPPKRRSASWVVGIVAGACSSSRTSSITG